MIEIFEKEETSMIEGEAQKFFLEVEQKDATHKHICYHDEGKGRPCKRVKL